MTLRRWAVLGVLFAGGWARAQAPGVQAPGVQPPAGQAPSVQASGVQAPLAQTPEVQAPAVQAPEDDPARFRVGINLGIISLPRPLIIEGYARVHPYIGIAGNWSYFPKFASDALLNWAGAQSDTTKAELNDFSGWEIAVRVYPLRGTFYLGVGFGHQNLEGTVTEKQGGFTGVGVGRVESWVIIPRVGWQWVWQSGFAIGVDLGVQVTVGHTDTIVLPPGTPPDVEQDVRDLIHFGASVPLPVLSFRIGYHFG